MQIKKTYLAMNPGLLYDEIKDFVKKQGGILVEAKMAYYSIPTDSSAHIARGTLIFKSPGTTEKECIRAHVIGSAKTEVKLIIDIDEGLFKEPQISALIGDLDYVFGNYEKQDQE